MEFRKAAKEDFQSVLDCVTSAFSGYAIKMGFTPPPIREDYYSFINNEEVIIAELDGKTIGVLVLLLKKEYLYLDVIAIKPEYQGKGYSHEMMDEVEKIAHSRNYRQIMLKSALAFDKVNYYPMFGYKIVMIEEMEDRTVAHFQKMLE